MGWDLLRTGNKHAAQSFRNSLISTLPFCSVGEQRLLQLADSSLLNA